MPRMTPGTPLGPKGKEDEEEVYLWPHGADCYR